MFWRSDSAAEEDRSHSGLSKGDSLFVQPRGHLPRHRLSTQWVLRNNTLSHPQDRAAPRAMITLAGSNQPLGILAQL